MSPGTPRATYGRGDDDESSYSPGDLAGAPRQRRKGPIEYADIPRGRLMRPFAFALMMSLTAFAAASAQPSTPDSENGRYSFNPVGSGMLRLDTRTGQVSQCSQSDAGWTCKAVPDERWALETEITRRQGEFCETPPIPPPKRSDSS